MRNEPGDFQGGINSKVVKKPTAPSGPGTGLSDFATGRSTAASRTNDVQSLNPPFDPRMHSAGGSGPAGRDRPMSRGRITNYEPGLSTYAINFLFNPSVLSTSFSIDPSVMTEPTAESPAVDPNAPKTKAVFVGEGMLNVDLLFDRSYEVWQRNNNYTAASVYGVYIDVLAFYMFCEMIDITASPNRAGANLWEHLYPQHAIARTNAFLYFGSKLKYFGYIESLAVTYSHFASDMTPIRCAISVGFKTTSFNDVMAYETQKKGTGADDVMKPKWWDGLNWSDWLGLR